MERPTPALACFPELARMLACNRTAPRNPSTLLQISDAELSAGQAPDRPRAQTAHQHHGERSSDCLPNVLLLAAASLGDCGTRLSMRAPPIRVRLQLEKALSGSFRPLLCGRAAECTPSLPSDRNAGKSFRDSTRHNPSRRFA